MPSRRCREAYQEYATYPIANNGAGIGTGIGMMNSDWNGKYTIDANITAAMAPDAPSDAYPGSLRCFHQVQPWLPTRPSRYSTANCTVPSVRSTWGAKK